MNQRRPKLGDILDDYCTRERRLTNHAIVAMVEDEVKLTRCTTCDTEHDFKHGKMPTLRRKKDAVSTAYKEVLAAVTGETATPTIAAPVAPPPEPVIREAVLPAPAAAQADKTPASAGDPETGVAAASETRAEGAAEEVRVHRRLIRATLPRPENHVPDRPVPSSRCISRPTAAGSSGAGRGAGWAAGTAAGERGGGQHGGQPRGPVFGRPSGDRVGPHGGRVPGRGDAHGPNRGGQPRRPGKKPSREAPLDRAGAALELLKGRQSQFTRMPGGDRHRVGGFLRELRLHRGLHRGTDRDRRSGRFRDFLSWYIRPSAVASSASVGFAVLRVDRRADTQARTSTGRPLGVSSFMVSTAR